MSKRVFAYCRVSTLKQTTENQVLAIRRAGFNIQEHRIITETVSGSVEAMKRDNIDVQNSIQLLTDKGVKVVCFDLPVLDFSSTEGKLMLQMFSAFAEFEINHIRERTKEGLERATSQGKQLGRPVAIATTVKVQECKADGLSQSGTATALGIGIATVKCHWNKSYGID